MTREAFEAALDRGLLQTLIVRRDGEHWYTCRRASTTKTWKRDPARFELTVKFRLRDHLRVRSEHFNNGQIDEWFRIVRAEGP